MPGAALCARPMTAAAMAAPGRWKRRTRPRGAAGSPASGWANGNCAASTTPSTPMPGRSGRKANAMTRKTIKVDYLMRVEGEGGLKVVIRDGRVRSAELRIFEPPRFFEALLRGRAFAEAPDIAARRCAICPVGYQMSAVHAFGNALGIAVTGPLRELRRLLYCGEWIESHTLHIYMLHAPDFLGYPGAVEMARDHADIVRRGLSLKKAGNEIMALLGGREIHPINVRVGGFYRTPRRRELETLAERLKWAREAAIETVRWTAGFDFPARERDYTFVALRHAREYPFNEGHIVSNRGLDITAAQYDEHFEETHVARSTALYSRLRGGGTYLVGPLARYSLNYDRLSPLAQEMRREAGLGPSRAPAPVLPPPRRRAAFFIIVTGCCPTARSPTRASSRRPRRIRRASRRISPALSADFCLSPKRPCASAASKPCAITTRASPALHIFCGLRSIAAETHGGTAPHRHRHRQSQSRRRCRRPGGGAAAARRIAGGYRARRTQRRSDGIAWLAGGRDGGVPGGCLRLRRPCRDDPSPRSARGGSAAGSRHAVFARPWARRGARIGPRP